MNEDFNAGLRAAAAIVLNETMAKAGTDGAAVGEMPATVPTVVLGDIYNKIVAAQKDG